MNSEKKYPDDYVEFFDKINTGRKELIWCIPMRGGNGLYVEFNASKDAISIREKEFWDGAVMRDDTNYFMFSDFSSGKNDEWIIQKLGSKTLAAIAEKLESEFGLKRNVKLKKPDSAESIQTIPEVKTVNIPHNRNENIAEPESVNAPAKKSKGTRMIGGGILLLLFAAWMIWFPLSRLIVTIPQKFSWEIRETKGTVISSGISEHTNYGKNTVTHVTNSWMKFSYSPNGKPVEVKLDNMDYDSLITGANGKWWLNTYPPGKEVPVFYYQGHPQYASTGRENIIPGFFGILLDFLLLLFGIVCLWLAILLFRK